MVNTIRLTSFQMNKRPCSRRLLILRPGHRRFVQRSDHLVVSGGNDL